MNLLDRPPWQRRAVTVPAVFATAVLLSVAVPLWLPIATVVDLARLRRRLPLVRLLAFAVCWAWIESVSITATFALWLSGQAGRRRVHSRLQAWWARTVLSALDATCGLRIEVEGLDAFDGGAAILLVRHASLADSLVSAYVTTNLCHLAPRYVLKRELLIDPCLDIVGNRIPNHFLDRAAPDAGPELAALTELTRGLGPSQIAVIFPEGTRANDRKRTQILTAVAARDPERAERLATLRHLLPPRAGGAAALLDGAAHADVVLAWHIGFEGLDTFGGVLRALRTGLRPVRFVARRVAGRDVPRGADFGGWLDEQWVRMDAEVDAALRAQQNGI
jgi:1-acyl-sn-glycerol-3-phosphate acyltransferase